MDANLQEIENNILAHRYLYYVEAQPVISDYIYDILEKEARSVLPESSAVQRVGSSLPSSYSNAVIKLAMEKI